MSHWDSLLPQTCLFSTTFSRDLIPISTESKSWRKLLAVIGHMTSLVTYKDSNCARSCMWNQKSYYVCLSLVVVAVEVISNLATTCWRQLVVFALTSEFMGKMFQAAQLTHKRFLTIDHSCKIFFLYLPNWTSTDL